MKKYEKPLLTAVSVSGNDQLCGSCSDEAAKQNKTPELLYKDPNSALAWQIDFISGDGVKPLTRQEASNAFGTGEACKDTVTQYCKFTSTGSLVAWS